MSNILPRLAEGAAVSSVTRAALDTPTDGSTVIYDERWRSLPDGMRLRLHARGELNAATLARGTAHELVELRALLASRVEAIDVRLRELDGGNTAGAPALRKDRS